MFGFDKGDEVEVFNPYRGEWEPGTAVVTGFDDSAEDGPRVFVQFKGSIVGADPDPKDLQKARARTAWTDDKEPGR